MHKDPQLFMKNIIQITSSRFIKASLQK